MTTPHNTPGACGHTRHLAALRAAATVAAARATAARDPAAHAAAERERGLIRACQALTRGTAPHHVHPQGWDLTTAEARHHFTEKGTP